MLSSRIEIKKRFLKKIISFNRRKFEKRTVDKNYINIINSLKK